MRLALPFALASAGGTLTLEAQGVFVQGHLEAAIDQAMRARPALAQVRRPWPWLRQGPVTLSAVPGGEIVAVIDVFEPRDDRLILHPPRVLSVENGFTRIALGTFGGVLFGWVPSARLTTSTAEYVDLSHDSFTSLGRERPANGNFVACDHDVPLVAEAGGQRRLVGAIRAGARLERLGAVAGWRQLSFPDAGIVAAEGASFWSRESDLVNCAH